MRLRRRKFLVGVGICLLGGATAAFAGIGVPLSPPPVSANNKVAASGTDSEVPVLCKATSPLEAGNAAPAPLIATIAGRHLVVPILMYHYIRVNPVPSDRVGFGLSVPPQKFAMQMAYLYRAGAHTITLSQLLDALAGKTALPSHPVVLTFDDGHDDFATQAVPVLRRYGFVGTDFVVPGFLGRPTYMTATQVRQVDAQGMVIGAHTVHHVSLAKISPSVARAEIVDSKQMLEELLGHPVLDFAYPYGSYNADVMAMVRAAGFRDAATTVSGDAQYTAFSFALERYKVGGGESLAAFARQALLPPPPANWKGAPSDAVMTVKLSEPCFHVPDMALS